MVISSSNDARVCVTSISHTRVSHHKMKCLKSKNKSVKIFAGGQQRLDFFPLGNEQSFLDAEIEVSSKK